MYDKESLKEGKQVNANTLVFLKLPTKIALVWPILEPDLSFFLHMKIESKIYFFYLILGH